MQLEKSLYGLAQSPGNWFHTIDAVLVEIGFVPLKSDTWVYLYDDDGVRIYLTLYVDDLLLASNNSEAMSMVKKKLQMRFKMTDMGPDALVDIGTKHLNKHQFKHLMDLISSFDVNDFISGKFK